MVRRKSFKPMVELLEGRLTPAASISLMSLNPAPNGPGLIDPPTTQNFIEVYGPSQSSPYNYPGWWQYQGSSASVFVTPANPGTPIPGQNDGWQYLSQWTANNPAPNGVLNLNQNADLNQGGVWAQVAQEWGQSDPFSAAAAWSGPAGTPGQTGVYAAGTVVKGTAVDDPISGNVWVPQSYGVPGTWTYALGADGVTTYASFTPSPTAAIQGWMDANGNPATSGTAGYWVYVPGQAGNDTTALFMAALPGTDLTGWGQHNPAPNGTLNPLQYGPIENAPYNTTAFLVYPGSSPGGWTTGKVGSPIPGQDAGWVQGTAVYGFANAQGLPSMSGTVGVWNYDNPGSPTDNATFVPLTTIVGNGGKVHVPGTVADVIVDGNGTNLHLGDGTVILDGNGNKVVVTGGDVGIEGNGNQVTVTGVANSVVQIIGNGNQVLVENAATAITVDGNGNQVTLDGGSANGTVTILAGTGNQLIVKEYGSITVTVQMAAGDVADISNVGQVSIYDVNGNLINTIG